MSVGTVSKAYEPIVVVNTEGLSRQDWLGYRLSE